MNERDQLKAKWSYSIYKDYIRDLRKDEKRWKGPVNILKE